MFILRKLSLLSGLTFLAAAAHASPLYLYTINFGPTPVSAFTSVSYLTQSLQNGTPTSFTPGESTVLSLPGSGATPYPGLGAGSISNAYASLAFNRNNVLTWLFEGDTASNITGAGTYAFSQTFLSTAIDPSSNYHPAGEVIVRELATPPVIFRYTESWNATNRTPGASFSYDSPVIIDGFLPLLGGDIQPISLPAQGTYPYPQGLFGVGSNLGEAYFVNSAGDYYFYTSEITPSFDGVGTYAFTSAGSGYNTTKTNTTGSVTVTAISQVPEPGSLSMGVLGAVCLAAFRWRLRRRGFAFGRS